MAVQSSLPSAPLLPGMTSSMQVESIADTPRGMQDDVSGMHTDKSSEGRHAEMYKLRRPLCVT